MPLADHGPPRPTPTQVISAAHLWGRIHGGELADDPEVIAAVLACEEVEWLEFPEALWEQLEVNIEDFPEEVRLEAERAAEEGAREEGVRAIQTMTLEQLEHLIDSSQPTGDEKKVDGSEDQVEE